MVMRSTQRRYTVAEVLEFPADGNRYELVDGELLVTPAPMPPHQILVGELYAQLAAYLGGFAEIARVLLSPADITWPREQLVQPDLFVVPAAEVGSRWSSYQTLLLAVEVLSPGSARGDRVVKRRLYQRQGVATYWVVDGDARAVEVWRPEDERPEIVTELLRWRISEGADELTINLPELFARLP